VFKTGPTPCEQRRAIQRLRVENEILRAAAQPLIHHAPARERFSFVHRLRDRFGIRRLCRILVTDHSNYHAWAEQKPAATSAISACTPTTSLEDTAVHGERAK